MIDMICRSFDSLDSLRFPKWKGVAHVHSALRPGRVVRVMDVHSIPTVLSFSAFCAHYAYCTNYVLKSFCMVD